MREFSECSSAAVVFIVSVYATVNIFQMLEDRPRILTRDVEIAQPCTHPACHNVCHAWVIDQGAEQGGAKMQITEILASSNKGSYVVRLCSRHESVRDYSFDGSQYSAPDSLFMGPRRRHVSGGPTKLCHDKPRANRIAWSSLITSQKRAILSLRYQILRLRQSR
jgi:hypothetical protein